MKVNVGVSKYDVIKTDNVVSEAYEGESLCGLCDSGEFKILVSDQYPTQTQAQSFFHELSHAIMFELGMVELNSDEGFIEALGKQLYGFFFNNDMTKLKAFLLGG